MISVSGLVDGGVFCHDFGEVLVRFIDSSLRVNYTVFGADGSELSSFGESYYPDREKCVRLRGLGEVMVAYLGGHGVCDMFSVDSGFMDIGGFATLQIDICDGGSGELLQSCSQVFYAADCRTGVFPSNYRYFLSRWRERMILPSQLLTCGYIYSGQRLKASVMCRDANGVTTCGSCFLDVAGVPEGHVVMHQYKPFDIVRKVANGAEVDLSEVEFITFELMDGSTRLDYMKMDIDYGHCRTRTGLLFKNTFGILEHFICKGQNKCTEDLDGVYAWIGRKYRKMYSDLTSMYTVMSGPIDEQAHQTLKDAVRSDEVYLMDDFVLDDMVTICDVDMERISASSKPFSDSVTYRVSDKVQDFFSRSRQLGARIFDDSFDKTFE